MRNLLLLLVLIGVGIWGYYSFLHEPPVKPPVLRLSEYVDEHIYGILGPLDRGSYAGDMHTLRQLREDVLDLSRSDDASRRSAYLAAASLCETLLYVLSDREAHLARINSAQTTITPSKINRSPHRNAQERIAFFVNAAEASWTDKCRGYHQTVNRQYAALRDAERAAR